MSPASVSIERVSRTSPELADDAVSDDDAAANVARGNVGQAFNGSEVLVVVLCCLVFRERHQAADVRIFDKFSFKRCINAAAAIDYNTLTSRSLMHYLPIQNNKHRLFSINIANT